MESFVPVLITALICFTLFVVVGFIYFFKTASKVAAPITTSMTEISKAVAERIKHKHGDITKQLIEAAAEIERLKSQKLSVSGIESVMEFGLMEVAFDQHNVQRYTILDTPSDVISKRKTLEYLGHFEVRYKKKIGVDFTNLRFELREPGKIAVSGLGVPKLLGVTQLSIKPILTEIRLHHTEGTFFPTDSSTILLDHPERINHERKQHDSILVQVNSEPCLASVSKSIEHMALNFLRMCFLPAGYDVINDSKITDGKTFPEICMIINKKWDDCIGFQESKMLELSQQQQFLLKDSSENP
ncbi:MAG: hypothetical protein SFY81_14580 [Verrucomicrobiota bacterium]|nr:hypothetical protein [Verrucomicrobiota bacterium]